MLNMLCEKFRSVGTGKENSTNLPQPEFLVEHSNRLLVPRGV